MHVSIEAIECILSLSFELKAMLLISSLKALCLSLLFLILIYCFLQILYDLFLREPLSVSLFQNTKFNIQIQYTKFTTLIH